MADLVKLRDGQCAITRYPDSTECTHLVPKAEQAWYIANNMDKYILFKTFEESSIDHPANGILLRADVQRCLDAHAFVFYPSSDVDPGADLDNSEAFVAYFVGHGYLCFPDLFHRRRVAVHPEVPVEFLYARFAHAIIHLPRENDHFRSVPEPPVVAEVRERTRQHQEEAKRMRADSEESWEASSDINTDRSEGCEDEDY